MTSDPASIWDLLSAELRGAVGPSLFDIWLAPLRVERYGDGELVLAAPAETRAWVAERFGRLLQTSAAAVLGDTVHVTVGDAPAHASDPAPSRRAAPPTGRRGSPSCASAPPWTGSTSPTRSSSSSPTA